MNLTYLVLLILLIVYIPIYIWVMKSPKAKEHGLVIYGPMVMIKTHWGIPLMTRLGKYKRFWRAFGLASKLMSLFLMIYIVGILVIDIMMVPAILSSGSGSGMGIEYALAIPGINPLLPIVYGWIGLIIAVVVHETAHGIQTKANDMEIDSTGILYGVLPLGAFVEPNEKQVSTCSRRARMDLYAAGIATNLVLAIVLFLVMFASLTCCVTNTYGDSPAAGNVYSDSPAAVAGIPVTAVIIDVDGVHMDDLNDLGAAIPSYGTHSITYVYKGNTTTVSLAMGTYVNSVVTDSPAAAWGLKSGDYLYSATLKVKDSEGNYVVSGDATYFGLSTTFSSFMKTTSGGQVYDLVVIRDGASVTIENVLLAQKNNIGYLGITTTTSGMSFTTPTIVMEKSVNPFYGRTNISGYIMGTLSYIAAPFNGYSPVPENAQWWYSTPFDAGSFWSLMSLIYWTFWLSFILGTSNAIPAVPFDGGFLFIGGVDWLLEKAGVKGEKREKMGSFITTLVSYIAIMALILVMLVIIF
jgi:membrane-associated protease RseP (regulator of RpoE activity)